MHDPSFEAGFKAAKDELRSILPADPMDITPIEYAEIVDAWLNA